NSLLQLLNTKSTLITNDVRTKISLISEKLITALNETDHSTGIQALELFTRTFSEEHNEPKIISQSTVSSTIQSLSLITDVLQNNTNEQIANNVILVVLNVGRLSKLESAPRESSRSNSKFIKFNQQIMISKSASGKHVSINSGNKNGVTIFEGAF